MSLIFSNLVASNIKLYDQIMCNLYAKYVKILEICKHFSGNLVNEMLVLIPFVLSTLFADDIGLGWSARSLCLHLL